MTRRLRHLRAVFAAGLAASAVGCVSLLPKQPPVQLYQFGQSSAPGPAAQAGPGGASSAIGRGQGALGVVLAQVSFPRAALGDGILTTRGEEAAYIAGARWLTPAVLMFQEDAERAFAERASGVRLIGRSELGAASALLRLDVAEFDARYDPAGRGAPTVVVSLRATLARTDGRRLVQQSFTERRPAGEDRVSAIVAAYDGAVEAVLTDVVRWTDAGAPALTADMAPGAAALPRHAVRGLKPEPAR